jgi:hypothetical protein
MTSFEKVCKYHFRLGLAQVPTAPSQVDALELTQLLSAPVPTAEHLGLRLGPAEVGARITAAVAVQSSSTTLTWRAGGGIWSITLTEDRLEATFDARGFADITGGELPTLTATRARIVRNLIAAAKFTGLPVNRAVVVVFAEGQPSRLGSRPRQVADRYVTPSTFEEAGPHELLDASVTLNFASRWTLRDEPQEVLVSRIEAVQSNWALMGGAPVFTLSRQWDVNTSPIHLESANFSEGALEDFFSRATVWCEDRINGLHGA